MRMGSRWERMEIMKQLSSKDPTTIVGIVIIVYFSECIVVMRATWKLLIERRTKEDRGRW